MIRRIAKARAEALEELEKGRISPDDYAKRTIRNARELVNTTPIPERPPRASVGSADDQGAEAR